jgi:hypothetical protein
MYEGEEMPEGQSSMTFRLVFRANDRTLKDEEVNTLMKKIEDSYSEYEGMKTLFKEYVSIVSMSQEEHLNELIK